MIKCLPEEMEPINVESEWGSSPSHRWLTAFNWTYRKRNHRLGVYCSKATVCKKMWHKANFTEVGSICIFGVVFLEDTHTQSQLKHLYTLGQICIMDVFSSRVGSYFYFGFFKKAFKKGACEMCLNRHYSHPIDLSFIIYTCYWPM